MEHTNIYNMTRTANEEKFGEKQFYYESQKAHSSQRFFHIIAKLRLAEYR